MSEAAKKWMEKNLPKKRNLLQLDFFEPWGEIFREVVERERERKKVKRQRERKRFCVKRQRMFEKREKLRHWKGDRE